MKDLDLVQRLAELLAEPVVRLLNERFDRLEALVQESSRVESVASKPVLPVKTGKLAPNDILTGIKVIQACLANHDYLVSQVIAETVSLQSSAVTRLIRVLDDALPFVNRDKLNGASVLKVTDPEAARVWLREMSVKEEWSSRFGDGGAGTSDSAFELYAPRIVRALMNSSEGLRTTALYQDAQVNRDMFNRIANRLNTTSPEPFLVVGVAPRGQSPLVRISNRDVAETWLQQHPDRNASRLALVR